MEQKILDALRPDFPDVRGEIALEATTDRFNGYILSDRFQGLSFVERQSRVFDILRKVFGEDSQQISMIFTYTSEEYELLQAA